MLEILENSCENFVYLFQLTVESDDSNLQVFYFIIVVFYDFFQLGSFFVELLLQ
jgi:hypothetical protein